MTMHPTPAERLLSMLEEEGAVEALPAVEVREELAALGIDPARSIAFAKSLARGGDSPGKRLMDALLAGKEEDDEIGRIESADIEEVRSQIPHAAAAAIAAEARRKAGIDGNVVGLDARRGKRRRLIVWGGPLAGIAASVLLVVVMGKAYLSTNRMEIAENISGGRAKAPAPAMPDPALEGYTKPGPDKSLTDELLALGELREFESAEQAKEKSVADSAPAAPAEEMFAFNEPAAPPEAEKKSVAPAIPAEGLRKAGGKPAAAGHVRLHPRNRRRRMQPRPKRHPAPWAVDRFPGVYGIVESPDAGLAAEAFEADTAALPPVDEDVGAGLVRDVEISEIAAVLVVDPSQAPLQIQSPILPSGGLADRVEEARRLAGDRPVIALYTIATGPARRDFAQVPLQTGLTQQMAAPSPLIGLLGVDASEYDFIALPAE